MALTATSATRIRRSSHAQVRGLRSGRVVGQRWYTPYLFMLPGLALFLLMFAWPAFVTFQLSFSRYDIVHPAVWIGFGNFVQMASDPQFWHALLNTFLFLIVYLPLVVVVPLLLAMLVNLKVPGIHAFRMIYYLPVVTSMVAVAIAWRYVFNQQGVLNWIIGLFHPGGKGIDWLLDTHWALPAIAIVEAWKAMGLYMIIYLAGLQAVPADLTDAARVDGAGAVKRFWHVTAPSMMPYLGVALTLGMLGAMQAFDSIYVLTQGGPQDATLTLAYYVWKTAFQNYNMGYASAVGLVMWAIMIVLALLNQFVTRRRDA